MFAFNQSHTTHSLLWERWAEARNANFFTRLALAGKSTNKVRRFDVHLGNDRFGLPRIKRSTLARAQTNASALDEFYFTPEGLDYLELLGDRDTGDYNLTANSIKSYAAAIRLLGIGNCLEHAVVALDYLLQRGQQQEQPGHQQSRHELELVLVGNNLHAFVVLGSQRPRGLHLPTFNFNDRPDVIICDPWANLVCPAINYPGQFFLKMRLWASQSKSLYVNENTFQNPTELHVNHSQEVVFSTAPT